MLVLWLSLALGPVSLPLGDTLRAALRLAGEQRARDAAQAMERGRQQAAEQYAGAQRLVRERTAGEQCAAADAVIDQELGL
ncbi:hypothetical protein HKT44_02630 [Pseudomonas aeruginosa]|nr:hypothetical protein [Pseudomonas aeruginosa]